MADTSNPQPSSEGPVPMSHRIDSWDNVNQQKSSPLFSVIPPELRNLIFKFTVAEFTAPALDRPIKHDFSARDDHEKLDDEPDVESGPPSEAGDQEEREEEEEEEEESSAQMPDVDNVPAPSVQPLPASTILHAREMKHSWDWFRPGYTGPRKMKTALLGTCRRVYLETCKLPSQGSKIFYNARGPPWCPRAPGHYVHGLAPGAAQHIRSLEIFPQLWYLERELMDLVTGVFSADTYFQRRSSPISPASLFQWYSANAPFSNPQFFHPHVFNPQFTNPQFTNPQFTNPQFFNPQFFNPQVFNPQFSNPQFSNPQFANPQLPGPMVFRRVFHYQPYQGSFPVGPLPQHAYRPGSSGPAIWRNLQQLSPRGLSEAGRTSPWRLTEHLTSLRIYLRRTDWWSWENNTPLTINPFNPRAGPPTLPLMLSSMRTSVEADRRVDPHLRSTTTSSIPRWDCWGLLFLRMPELQELTISFETSEDKKVEMESIVEWAHRGWRFPVLRRLSGTERDPYTFSHMERSRDDTAVDLLPWSQDLDVLSAADEPVQKTSWRGLPHHFSEMCHRCRANWGAQEVTLDCTECTKREKLLALNKGPQLLVWTVNWKRKVPPRHAQPEGSTGGEGSQERGGQPRQDGPGPHSAEHRARRRRELDELLRREVMF